MSLDEWKSREVQNMVRWGNKRANAYWEARVPESYYIPDENDGVGAVERWIRDKYEKKKFVAKSLPSCATEDIDLSLPIATLLGGSKSGSDEGKTKKKASSLTAAAATPAAAAAPKASKAAAPAAAPAPAAAADDALDLLGFDSWSPA